MAEHIRYTAAPLSEVLCEAAQTTAFERLPFLCCDVIRTAADPRQEVCQQIRQSAEMMALTVDDVRLLCEFIGGCGTADLEGEVQRCRQYTALFDRRHSDARADAERRGRLYVTLGICGGSALALVLGG